MTDYLRVKCTFDLLNKARIEIGHGEDKKAFDTLVHLCKLMTGGKDIPNQLSHHSISVHRDGIWRS